MQRILSLLALLVVIGAAGRLFAICAAPQSLQTDLRPIRRMIDQRWREAKRPFEISESLADQGVTQIAFERFDPDAIVLMRPGADRQPGVAGVDDNANGIVDDASELGATRSDDVCLVQPSQRLNRNEEQSMLVLQHGAFVPSSWDQRSDPSAQWRAIVTGQTADDHWSFLVTGKLASGQTWVPGLAKNGNHEKDE